MRTDPIASRDARAINAAVAGFLEYYVDPEHPLDYAVLISGPWGSGKTHLVRKFLESTSARPLFVSLYGLTSTSQIEEEFFRQLHPVLSGKGMKLAGSVLKAFAKGALKIDFDSDGKDDGTLNVGLPEIDVKAGLSDPRDRLLVFDDLERCKMPIGEVLGFINAFVEHDGLKAIIIANETKVLEADQGYKEIKEKLIGQTLEVAAAAEEAFDAFLTAVSDERTRAFLDTHRATVLAVHTQGGRENLRTLKHAMWDFEKIARELEDRHWSNEDAIAKLMEAILAAAMEKRAGQLDDEVIGQLLGNQIGRLLRLQGDRPRGPVDEIAERYPQIGFDDICITPKTLAAVLLRGAVDPDAILAEIDASRDFAPAAEQPLWARAQRALREDDATVAALTAEVAEAFAAMEIRERGELMHLFGARLWFSQIGVIPETLAQLLAEGLAYIAKLEDAGLIESKIGEDKSYQRDNSYYGYRVFSEETPEFKALANAYAAASEREEQSHYEAIGYDLIRRLETEPDEVVRDAVVNNVRAAPYYNHPVFTAVPTEYFVERILGWSPKTQIDAIELLHARHELRHGKDLDPERLWVHEVDRLLTAALPALQPMSRHRLQALIDKNLVPLRPAQPAPPVVPPATVAPSAPAPAPAQQTKPGKAAKRTNKSGAVKRGAKKAQPGPDMIADLRGNI